MLIQIDKLKRRPRQILIEEQAGDFPVLQELMADGSVAFNQVIRGELTATWAGEVIEVSGSLATSITTPCGRCLVPVTEPLAIPVMLCYAGIADEGELAAAEDVELATADLGLIAITGPEIDLRPDLEQEIIMALPQQTLCMDTCQGLCPVCGANLNQDRCGCEAPVFHAGLAALKKIKIEP